MAQQVDRDDPAAAAKRAFKLAGKGARGGRIAVNQHDRRTVAGGLVDGERSVRGMVKRCFGHGRSQFAIPSRSSA